MRAVTSGVEPAANGTISLTCLVGHSCAVVGSVAHRTAQAASRTLFIVTAPYGKRVGGASERVGMRHAGAMFTRMPDLAIKRGFASTPARDFFLIWGVEWASQY